MLWQIFFSVQLFDFYEIFTGARQKIFMAGWDFPGGEPPLQEPFLFLTVLPDICMKGHTIQPSQTESHCLTQTTATEESTCPGSCKHSWKQRKHNSFLHSCLPYLPSDTSECYGESNTSIQCIILGKKSKFQAQEPKVTELKLMHLNKGSDMQNWQQPLSILFILKVLHYAVVIMTLP